MEPYLEKLADMRRRELITDARPDLGAGVDDAGTDDAGAAQARDPLRGAPRARMAWWIAADRLRRTIRGPAAIRTATIKTATIKTTRSAR
jgi:hypothetical protein